MPYLGHDYINHPDIRAAEGHYVYNCGHCNTRVSGIVVATYMAGTMHDRWLLCTNCGEGSIVTTNGIIHPGIMFGPTIEGLPDDVSRAYNEARGCISVNAFTSCELMCRKILMHVAVEKGANEGESFTHYLSYLGEKGYITDPMKGWVDLIREHGNKAAHLLESPDRNRAESTLMFTAELLRIIYEMEHMAKQYTPES